MPMLWGDKFDSTMNYRFLLWTLDFIVGRSGRRMEHGSSQFATAADSRTFGERVEWFAHHHPKQVVESMMNNMGSHDLPRISDLLNNDEDCVKLAHRVLMTLPGIPTTWYGDEIGMHKLKSERALDPLNRKPFDWDLLAQSRNKKNPVLDNYREMVKFREQHPILRSAEISFLKTEDPDIIVYLRYAKEEASDFVLVVANRAKVSKIAAISLDQFDLPKDSSLKKNIDGMKPDQKFVRLTINPISASIYTPGVETSAENIQSAA